MNKYTKLFALLGTAFLLGSCQEDSLLQSEGPLSGNEIRFGATAHFKNGNSSTTRTEYGDIEKDENGNGFIEVRWSNGDRIDIACPSTAGTNCAEYVVSGFDHGTDEDGKNQSGAQSSTATTLTKTGDAGLQWGSSEDNYTFYSVYPSLNTIKGHLQGIMPDAELNNLGVSEEGTLAGYLAQVQDAAPASVDNARNNPTVKGDTTGYVIKPNMDFAYMVAKTPNVVYGNDVSLRFESIVTALEFQIFAPDVVGDVGEITVTGFALSDPNNGDISGPFSYYYNTGEYATPDGGAANGHSLVQMNILGTDDEGVTITKDQYVDVTFFLLPRADEQTYGILDLTVFYKVGNSTQVKTATLNRGIAPRTKTYIKNIKLPKITNVNASSWWSAIPPATLFSQVSIPVAGNVFANAKYGVTDTSFVQQSKKIEDLWYMGVRGFEICTANAMRGKSAGSYNNATETFALSLGDQKVLVAEEEKSDFTFGDAFNTLVGLLKTEGHNKEPLVVICTYMPSGDGCNPYTYVSNLFNYLTEYVGNNNYGITMDDFVQIGTSTTAGDISGKIAIIIRPGEDQRWLYETTEFNNRDGLTYDPTPLTNPFTTLGISSYSASTGLTAQIPDKLTSDWWHNVLMIADWGCTSYDKWDRRYGSDWATAATFDDMTPEGRKLKRTDGNELYQMEQFLYGTNRNYTKVGVISENWGGGYNTSDNEFNYYNKQITKPISQTGTKEAEFNFEHKMSNKAKAFIQEWARVVKNDIGPICVQSQSDGLFTNPWSVWAKWTSSIDEKKEAIKDLFNMCVKNKGQKDNKDLHINVLSGYYVDATIVNGAKPFRTNIPASRDNVKLTNQGKGGYYKGLAKDLNEYVYGLLTATPSGDGSSQSQLIQQGPWGLVMIDHIGTDGDNGYSTKMVDLIMMNNFRFPLAVGSSDGSDGSTSGSDSGEGL